jgi:hypothetical protein
MRTHGGLHAERVFAAGGVMTPKQELMITRCMLLGCTFHFDNYGHPEREQARKYHTCVGQFGTGFNPVTGYGHTQAEAAWDWLRRTGNQYLFLDAAVNLRDRA